VLRPSGGRLTNDAPEEAHAGTAARLVAPWEQRVRSEQADLEVTRIRRERAELIRAERAEREASERAADDAERIAVARAAERERVAAFEVTQEKRLNELRDYGKACAVWAPAEYQAKVVRNLLSSVNIEDYPPDLSDYLSRAQISAQVEKVLKPWRDEEARKRAMLESRRKLDSLILTGKWYAQIETVQWDRRAADRAKREVEATLRGEVDADWTADDVRDLVDDVLDEWFEE
jgi:hypothetical protein